jgi:hypothetical protein
MRKRGPSGGGTLRRVSPQQGQRPSMPKGLVASARSQWPRASHCGLMHCTVKPGRNCISFPSATGALLRRRSRRRGPDPLATLLRTNVGADSGAVRPGCQEKRPPYMVVPLRVDSRTLLARFMAELSRKTETAERREERRVTEGLLKEGERGTDYLPQANRL